MDNNTITRLILIGILVLVSIAVVKTLLGMLSHIIGPLIGIAALAGIAWVVYNALRKKNRAY
jgi:uncharacterized membrane protein YuzA (DUF378 family)